MKKYKIFQLFFGFTLILNYVGYGQAFSYSGGTTGPNSPVSITVDATGGSTGIYIGKGNTPYFDALGIGVGALNSMSTPTQGSLAIGFHAMFQTTLGYHNTAVGSNVLATNTTGFRNTAFGYNCLVASGSLNFNAAFGENALAALVSGNGTNNAYNAAFGNDAGFRLNTGANNTFIGNQTGFMLTQGDGNIAIGEFAMNNLQTGYNNVAIGTGVNLGTNPTTSNELAIQNVIYGSNMTSPGAGHIGIGIFPGGTSKLEIGGTLKINTVSPVANPGLNFLYVDGTGIVKQSPVGTVASGCTLQYFVPVVDVPGSTHLNCSEIYDNGTSVGIHQYSGFGFTTGVATTITPMPAPSTFKLSVDGWISGTGFTSISDQRLKRDIKKIENPIAKISKITGYTYYWNKDFKTTRQLDDNKQAGFLAQEVLKVLPEAVIRADDGIYGLNYNAIMPLLAEGIKEQQTQIEKQGIMIANQETQIAELRTKINQLIPGNVIVKDNNFQIVPNPVTGKSVVSYKLDSSVPNALFIVYDLQGRLLKRYVIDNNAKQGEIQLNKTEFANGMYILSLVSNNEEIQSKKFLIAE